MAASSHAPLTLGAVAEALRAQASLLAAELGRHPKQPRRKQVHRMRVTIRRLSVALELADAAGYRDPERCGKRLAKLLKKLSPLRDADVQLRSLRRLPPSAISASFVERLQEEKRAAQRDAVKRLSRFDAAALQTGIARLAATLAANAASPAERALVDTALRGELARRHLGIERSRRRRAAPTPHQLHRLRIRLKSYRYALELLADQLPAVARELLETASRLQDGLGLAHDRHVLAEMAARHAGSSKQRKAQQLARRLNRESDLEHERAVQLLGAAVLPWPLPTPAAGEGASVVVGEQPGIKKAGSALRSRRRRRSGAW